MSEDAPKRRGRPPMPEGQARTAEIKIKVKPAAAEALKVVAKSRGLTVSAAIRDALQDWLNRPGHD